MKLDLIKEAAYSNKTPYELWQQTEEIPIYGGLAVEDLKTISLGPWKRKRAMGAFINMLGAGRSCDAYVCEIPARDQTCHEQYLFEELIYVIKGRGATSVWNVEERKQTFEWQEGSTFSPPLNTWRQHFNAQSDEPARFLALTDAPVMINRFRNLDFIFNNSFHFSDRFSGQEGYFSGKGRRFNRIEDGMPTSSRMFPGFRLLEHSTRGQGARGGSIAFFSQYHQRAYRRISGGHLSARSLAWTGRPYPYSFRRRVAPMSANSVST
jgi:hypothetical protein